MPGKYAPTAWGQFTVDLTCPSGQVCQARKVAMEDIVELDILDDVDFLGGIVSDHADNASGKKKPQDRQPKKLTKAQEAAKEQQELRDMMADKSRFRKMVHVMDKLVSHVVVQPEITSCWQNIGEDNFKKIPEDEREEGVIYSDSVSLADKMYIFDYCFEGVSKTKSFREESGKTLESVEDESGSGHEAE